MELNDKIFSYFFPAFGESSLTTSLDSTLRFIGSEKLRDKVLRCREYYILKDLKNYDLLKKTLPAVTFSGVFNSKRKTDFLETYTGLIIFDIDKLTLYEVECYFETIKVDKYVISIWRSPSGHGLKFLIYHEFGSSYHKKVFSEAKKYFEERYAINIDKSGSDISRLCFLSFDDKLHINKECTKYLLIENDSFLSEFALKPTVEKKSNNANNNLVIGIVMPDKVLNVKKDKKLLLDIYHFLLKRNLSITETYDTWVRVAYVISDNFPYTVGKLLFIKFCELDKSKHDETKSIALINTSYKTIKLNDLSLGTILYLAEEKGFIRKFSAPKSSPKKIKTP